MAGTLAAKSSTPGTVTALLIAEAVAIALLAVLVAGLLRSHAEILRALHELGANLDPDATATAPRVVAPARSDDDAPLSGLVGTRPDGNPVKIALSGRHSTLLAFLTTGCATCDRFWDTFGRGGVPADLPGTDTRLVIVVQGAESESPARVSELAPASVTTVVSTEAWQRFRVPVAPYFILIDPGGSVAGEGAAASWPQVASLLEQAMRDRRALEVTDGPRDRHQSIDDQLAAAGVHPGHPSLYPTTTPD